MTTPAGTALATVTRRSFLQASATAAGGLLVSLYLDLPLEAQQRPPQPKVFPPDAFIEITADDRILIQVNRLEFGQGVATALPQALAEELDADWAQVVPQLARAADVYKDPRSGIQMVGGSGSIAHSYEQYRELGAKTRAMLVAAAAKQWNVAPEQCRAEKSVVLGPGGRRLKYSELAAEAAQQPVPATPVMKKPAEFQIIGHGVRRVDSAPKCNGAQKFGLDLDLPGMVVALVAHPPVWGAKPKSVDDAAARAVAGVRDVFPVPVTRGGMGVAVVAEKFWPAKQARDRLKIEWDTTGVQRADSGALWQQYRQLAQAKGLVALARGDENALAAIPDKDRIVAEFEFPYIPHTPLEPLNATVRWDGEKAEAWVPSQFQTMDQANIAHVLGLKPEQVLFHTEYAGGGFGRRAVPDSHVQREAAEIAKRLKGTPVKLIWTREDDVQGGYYRPMVLHRAEIGVEADGMPAAWKHVVVGQSLLKGTPFEAMLQGGLDDSLFEGVNDTHYTVPNFHVWAHYPDPNVPVLWWRSVGNTHTAYVMETLIDELAERAQADPIAYRRRLLAKDAKKLHAVLELLEQKSAWRNSLPQGHSAGVACHESFGTGVACAVEVSLERGKPRIHRATVAVDCGTAVNPLSVAAQMQGGLAFGMSQLVPHGYVSLKDGTVEQRNFDGYRPPYLGDAPMAVDVHIVPSTEKPTGCGEPPVPVISPAVANALARLTGKRYRRLPIEQS